MESILSVLIVFVFSVLCHRLLHLALRKKQRSTMWLVSVYGIGFFALAGLLFGIHSTTFFSSLALYVGMSALVSYLYLGVVLGGETPSSMMLRALKERRSMSKTEIISLFTEEKLVWKRIEDLQRVGLVLVQPQRIVATKKGKLFTQIIALYEVVFHRKERG